VQGRSDLHTVEVEIIHRGNIRLCLPPNEPYAIRLATIAGLSFMPIESPTITHQYATQPLSSNTDRKARKVEQSYAPVSIHIIIERQLLVLLDVPTCEDAHPDVLPDRPFCDVAVWATAVVRETPDSASFRGVNELLLCVAKVACEPCGWVELVRGISQ
jgi:hypothetical protein